MSHTDGKLSIDRRGNIKTEDQDYFRVKGAMLSGREVAEANTRRLVACWNAMEGVDDPELWVAQMRFMDADHTKSLDIIQELQKERDEALEALSMAMQWIDSVPSNTQLPAMPGFERDHVDAILAKHQKGNDHGQE